MRESTFWVLQLLSGLAIFVLLSIHMGVIHLDSLLSGGKDVLSYGAAAARGATMFWTVLYVVLLALALYHGLYGLRNIFLEMSLGPTAGRVVTVVLFVVGVVAFVYGTYVTVAFSQMGGV